MTTVQESASGTLFPSRFRVPGESKELELIGCGLREKKVAGLFGVKVYAIACYVEPEAARAALSSFKDKKKLQDPAFFDALCTGPFDMSFSMCFVRDITHEQFAGGIKDAVEPKLKAKGAPDGTMSTFVDALSKVYYTKGSRVFLSLLHPGRVVTAGLKATEVPKDFLPPEGTATSVVECEALGPILRDVYFGKESVVPSLKSGVSKEAWTLLGREE